MEPKPHRPGGPPIWIGGSGPTALREAARFDAWFPTGPHVEFFAEQFPSSRRPPAPPGVPRMPSPARPMSPSRSIPTPPPPSGASQLLETYYAAPARTIMARQATYAGPLEGCVDWLQRWIAAGCHHLMFRFAGGDQLAQVDETATRLLPRLRTR